MVTQNIGLDNGLSPGRRQAIIWTNADPIHWRTYAAQRRDGLDRDNMVVILQTIFSIFLQWQSLNFLFNFHGSELPMVQQLLSAIIS